MNPEELLTHADFVHALARRLVLDEHRAADLEQDTWLAALKSGERSIRSPRAWLSRVVRNLATNLYRKEGRKKKYEQSVGQSRSFPSPDTLLARGEARQRLIEAVLDLDDPYRSVLLLRYYEDRSAREIASEERIPLETVRTRIKKGLEKLKGRLDAMHDGDRRVWCMALAPLAGFKLGATAAASAGTASLFTGVIVMSTKLKAALAAVLIVGVGLGIYIPLTSGSFDGSVPDDPEWKGFSRLDKVGYGGTVRSEETSSTKRVPIASAAGPFFIRGTVVDPAGQPAGDASIRLLWMDETKEDAPVYEFDEPSARFNDGAIVHTGADGRFEVSFEKKTRCYAYLFSSGSFLHQPNVDPRTGGKKWQGRWIETPAEDVAFTIQPKPTARVILQVVEEETGARLSGFDCTFWSRETKNYDPGRAEGDYLEKVLPVHEGREAGFTVTVYHPAVPKDLRKSFTLRPGDLEEVTVTYPRNRSWEIVGKVVDASGVAVRDALVYFGGLPAGRGDEPFKPFVPQRIKSGARTDADGTYRLVGRGEKITAWHEAHGPATVQVVDAGLIELPSRGAIDGVLLDDAGRPRQGVEIMLDRQRKAVTDEWGRFFFEGVEPGIRGLILPGKVYAAVDVIAGETARAALNNFLPEVRVELYANGQPYAEPGRFAAVGLDRLFTLQEARAEGGVLLLRDILPGTYLLLARDGRQVAIEIETGLVTAEFGTAGLTVSADEGVRVYVVPAGAHELVSLIGGRHSARPVPASGEIRFDGLEPGRYAVGIDRKGLRATVEVSGPGATLRIR